MISYFDTSALLPAFVKGHPNFLACHEVIDSAQRAGQTITCTNHTLSELYTNLTKLPHGLAFPPAMAESVIQKIIGDYLSGTINLEQADYLLAIKRCAQLGLVSGVIYDALHLQAAIKAEADVLYTANLRDFKRLWSDELTMKLVGV